MIHISEPIFAAVLKAANLPPAVTEYQFAPPRKWRFDYCWLPYYVALEVEGGIWTRGRHTRGAGFLKDMEKYNEAAALGWLVIRTTPTDLCTDKTLSTLRRVIERVRTAA